MNAERSQYTHRREIDHYKHDSEVLGFALQSLPLLLTLLASQPKPAKVDFAEEPQIGSSQTQAHPEDDQDDSCLAHDAPLYGLCPRIPSLMQHE